MIKNVKTLAFLTIGAFAISATYALLVGNDTAEHTLDEDEERAAHHNNNGDSGEFVFKGDNYTVKAEWRGDYSLNGLGTGLGALDDELEIEIKQGGGTERVKFERRSDAIHTAYYSNGDKQPKDEETDNAAAALFLKFLRISGLKSDGRVAALTKAGGVASVLEEIDALERDRAVRRYAVSLIEQSDLSPAEIDRLAEKLALIESDHDLRVAAAALLDSDALTSAQAASLLTTAGRQIDSDHDLRMLLTAGAVLISTDGDVANAWMDAYAELQSGYDQRLALEKIAAAAKDDPALMTVYRKAAQAISDDTDRKRAFEAIDEEADH